MHLIIILAFGLAMSAFASEQPVATGSGSYLYSSTTENSETRLEVYYHKPTSFTQDSPVLLVIPGSGRNAWDYRDAWKEAAEKYGVLILAPHYSEKQYPEFWDYNIAGMLTNVTINEDRTGQDFQITTSLSTGKIGYSKTLIDCSMMHATDFHCPPMATICLVILPEVRYYIGSPCLVPVSMPIR